MEASAAYLNVGLRFIILLKDIFSIGNRCRPSSISKRCLFPVHDSSSLDINRRRTDVCCTIWAVLFSVTLLVYAIAAINTGTSESYAGNLIKTNFPTDGAGKLCGKEHSAYHYVYYPTPSDVVLDLIDADQTTLCQEMPDRLWRSDQVSSSWRPHL